MSTQSVFSKLSIRNRDDSVGKVLGQHLVDLMNCAVRGARIDSERDTRIARSVLNYGCPPLKMAGIGRIDPELIASHICDVMRIFEPRVDSARTRVRSRFCDNNGIKGALYFDILMADRNDGSEISISLEFDYLSAFFSVVGD